MSIHRRGVFFHFGKYIGFGEISRMKNVYLNVGKTLNKRIIARIQANSVQYTLDLVFENWTTRTLDNMPLFQ